MRRNRSHRKIRRKLMVLIIFLLFLTLTGFLLWCLKARVEPNLEEIGRMRAKVMVSQIVNKALNDELNETDDMNQLLIREVNDAGQLEVLQANTQAMNLLATEICKELQEEFAERPKDVYSVPLGVLLGDRILSQTGFEVDLTIIPLSVSSVDFKTEFESEGINQTKYKVYLDMECEVKALAPFSADTFPVSTTVLVAEAVILGGVPDSYVNVPEEDILDVTNE